jgi:hypothetical protein
MAKMTAQNIVSPSAENLAASVRAATKKGKPPVHLWNPPFCGDLDIRIAADGTWFYLGTPIGRPGLVKLFSSILRKDGEKFFLVTPVEKVGITVDDAPFVAVDFAVSGEGTAQDVTFTTHVDDHVTAGAGHPLRVVHDPATDEPRPYVMVRDGLEALIDRKSFYRLVDLGTHSAHQGKSWFGIWSGGVFFPVIPSSDLSQNEAP